MTTHEDNGKIPYRALVSGLLVLVVGLVVYVYQTKWSAQAAVDTTQNEKLETQNLRIGKVETAIVILAQIACQQKGANCTSLNLSSINK